MGPQYRSIIFYQNNRQKTLIESKIDKIESEKNLQIGTITIGLCILSEIKPHIFGFDLSNKVRTHYFESRPSSFLQNSLKFVRAVLGFFP